jgi:hypothetical protein
VPTICLKPIRGKAMRVTKLDACGTPVVGLKSVVVSAGMVSIEQKLNLENADEFIVKNANGDLCINFAGQARLKWIDTTITFCQVDPELVNLTTGSPVVFDDAATPQAVGWRTRENVSAEFALETWTDLDGQPCTGGTKQYGYFLLPWITGSVEGDVTVQNGPVSFSVTGRTHNNSPWGLGPHNIRLNAALVPSKLLVAIDPLDHRHIQVTTLAPPATACGAIALS